MLNISDNEISSTMNTKDFGSFKVLRKKTGNRVPILIAIFLFVLAGFALLLPWTQNIQGKGKLTTLDPSQKPQAIQSVISGKLEEWYVQEGDYVKKGDTIVFISEIKSEYFDPELIARTDEQVKAKSSSVNSYSQKVRALENQYKALEEARDLKLRQLKNKIIQAENKIKIDSMDLIAFRTNQDIAEKQIKRTQELYDKGLKSLTDLETKKLKRQETQAKVIVQENKLANSKNELINYTIQLSSTRSEYDDKLAKAQSDKYSALSNQLDASASTSKLKNQLSNYNQRQQFYYITAPQNGYLTKAIKKGVGEIIKEGTDIITIMPSEYDFAVELYVRPVDLPLLEIGNKVMVQFDGWPAIIFSGWPQSSAGMFEGEIFAIDRFISENDKYRILVTPIENEKPWPDLLRVGSGVKAFILLKDVKLGYELWRQLNGFPPDFYKENTNKDIKLKAPIKSIK